MGVPGGGGGKMMDLESVTFPVVCRWDLPTKGHSLE